ncbi:MAG: XrtA system polysaccharide deacetylase [Thermodesulfobacteriota bacterium]
MGEHVKNALSIDLEDWFCVYNLSQVIRREDWDSCELRITKNTELILNLLDKHKTSATFFVLGWIAERVPDLVREIELQGHEIATHGYSHTLVTDMTREAFEKDLKKALQVTRRLVKQEILGFRAPSFSITSSTLWAVDVLVKNNIRYDSSIFPISSHPDYGIRDAPLSIHQLDGSLIEVPLSCAEFLGRRIPCSGGGYFRIFPYAVTKFLLKRCNRQGRPIIFYLHPWELDPDQPKVKLPWLKRFRHYYNLSKCMERLNKLLTDFEFTAIKEIL